MKRIKLSLFDILARLAQTAPTQSNPPDESEGRVTHSIRFPADVRQWITMQSDHLGVSIQDFVSLTMKGVMLTTNSPQTDDFATMVMRFFLLFKAHDIATADIPSFLPENTLARSELRDANKIIDALNDDVIKHLATIFEIDGNWLKGKTNRIYKTRTFYKSLSSVAQEMIRLKSKSQSNVYVWFLTRSGIGLKELAAIRHEENSHRHYENVQVILKHDKTVNGYEITTYQLWDNLSWDYWRSRYYAKALIYFCNAANFYVSAYSLQENVLSDIIAGKEFLSDIRQKGQHWTIDELTWDQECNPERDELQAIEDFYKEEDKDGKHLYAANYPWKIKNYDDFINGGHWMDVAPEEHI